jgi:hypothetical protein
MISLSKSQKMLCKDIERPEIIDTPEKHIEKLVNQLYCNDQSEQDEAALLLQNFESSYLVFILSKIKEYRIYPYIVSIDKDLDLGFPFHIEVKNYKSKFYDGEKYSVKKINISLAKSSISCLISSSNNMDVELKSDICNVIKSFGIVASEQLIEALSNPNKNIRILALTLLGDINDDQVFNAIKNTLTDEDNDVRDAALLACNKFNYGTKSNKINFIEIYRVRYFYDFVSPKMIDVVQEITIHNLSPTIPIKSFTYPLNHRKSALHVQDSNGSTLEIKAEKGRKGRVHVFFPEGRHVEGDEYRTITYRYFESIHRSEVFPPKLSPDNFIEKYPLMNKIYNKLRGISELRIIHDTACSPRVYCVMKKKCEFTWETRVLPLLVDNHSVKIIEVPMVDNPRNNLIWNSDSMIYRQYSDICSTYESRNFMQPQPFNRIYIYIKFKVPLIVTLIYGASIIILALIFVVIISGWFVLLGDTSFNMPVMPSGTQIIDISTVMVATITLFVTVVLGIIELSKASNYRKELQFYFNIAIFEISIIALNSVILLFLKIMGIIR